jgi:hypothetical protein
MSALITVAAGDVAAVLATAGADIRFLFDRKGVDAGFAVKLYSIGITSVELFAVFAKDQGDLEDILKRNFDIDPADIFSRVKISKIVVAWLSAKTRAQRQTEQDGDCEVRRVPRDIPLTSVAAMYSAFELAHWQLDDKQKPARSYLERKLDEVEKGELRAEPLEEVVSVEEDDPDMLRTEWKPDGQLRAVRVGTKVSLPVGPEELRKRLALLGTTLMFAGYQQAHKAYLQGLTPQVFVEYVEYLLGDHVLKLASRGAGGAIVSSPSWSLLLSYEHAIRKKMVQLVNKGQTIKDSLKLAMEDPVTKERFFTTPLCVEAVSGKRHAPSDWGYAESQGQPGKGGKASGKGAKGKGKNNAKGVNRGKEGKRAKNPKHGCLRKTPEDNNICFKFNSGGCSTANCPYVHVCGRCFTANVPMDRCKKCGTGSQ